MIANASETLHCLLIYSLWIATIVNVLFVLQKWLQITLSNGFCNLYWICRHFGTLYVASQDLQVYHDLYKMTRGCMYYKYWAITYTLIPWCMKPIYHWRMKHYIIFMLQQMDSGCRMSIYSMWSAWRYQVCAKTKNTRVTGGSWHISPGSPTSLFNHGYQIGSPRSQSPGMGARQKRYAMAWMRLEAGVLTC